MKLLITILCGFINVVASQKLSPCPDVFVYEQTQNENDRWYGVISLKTTEDLEGVWLRLTLDRPAILLGNWFGEAVSTDNIEYLIRNREYELEAGPPVSIRFFVKYNTSRPAPKLVEIKLNAKTICTSKRSESDLGPTTPKLHISQLRPTEASVGENTPSNSNSGNSRPGENNRQSSNTNRPPTTSKRPSSSNNSNKNDRRPTNSNTGRPISNSDSNSNSNRQTINGRPSYNTDSTEEETLRPSRRPSNSGGNRSQTLSNSNENIYFVDRPSGSSVSSSSLSVDTEEESENDDFFPGDFANLVRPSQSKPISNTNQVGTSSSSCGTIAARPTPLIYQGQDTWPGQWPWHAALYHSKGIQLMYTCGATLITERHIITAAHCVTKPQTNRAVNPSNILVYLGKYSLITFGPEVQDRGVASIHIHPEYNYTVYFNDIAVLKLSQPVTITNFVRPCCLWEGDSSLDNIIRREGTVVGWGFDENRKLSNKLMQAKMPIVSTVDCIYSNRDFFSQFTFEKNFCAGFRNGTSVCNGDSGGGMVFPKRGTSGQDTVWQVRGIVSVGVALQGQGICDTSQYIVFTDVAKHTHWIRQVLSY